MERINRFSRLVRVAILFVAAIVLIPISWLDMDTSGEIAFGAGLFLLAVLWVWGGLHWLNSETNSLITRVAEGKPLTNFEAWLIADFVMEQLEDQDNPAER